MADAKGPPPRTPSGVWAAIGRSPDELATKRAEAIADTLRILKQFREHRALAADDKTLEEVAHLLAHRESLRLSNTLLVINEERRRGK